jgi:hypothetical protein
MNRPPSDYERAIQLNAKLAAENRELKAKLRSSRTYYARVAHLWKTRYMRLREGSKY